jgi:hypothetical protein
MTTASRAFLQIGRALFGDHFKAPMAAALEISVDRVDDWSKGRGNPPPAGVWRDLVQILDDRLSNLPRLRTAALVAANATGLRLTAVDFQGTHIVVDAKGEVFRGSLETCEKYIAQETERAFRAASEAGSDDLWHLAARLTKGTTELVLEVRRRGFSQAPFDERNLSGVVALISGSISTGDRKAMLAALVALETLYYQAGASTNAATQQPALDLIGNKPSGPERIRS